jgi:hypothetical protein
LEEKGTDTRAMDFRKFEELAEVLERKWTKESYALTKVEYGDPLRPNVENLVVFCDEQPDKWPKNIKRVIDTYPDVKDAEKVPCEGGSYGVLEQIMKIRTSKEAKGYEERRKCFVAAFLDSSKEDRNVEKDVFHVTREIRKLFGNEASTNVRMTLPQGIQEGKLCLNCAQDGHKKSECGREAFCPLCERMGHAAGAGSCKIFREALETARRNKRGNESAEPRRISNEEGAREPSKNGE